MNLAGSGTLSQSSSNNSVARSASLTGSGSLAAVGTVGTVGLRFTTTPSDAVIDPLTGYSTTFNWTGAPAGTTFQTRLNNNAWLNNNFTASKQINVSGLVDLDATRQTFHVIPRYQDGTVGAPITHEWNAGMFDLARSGMSGTWKNLVIKVQWSGASLVQGTSAQNTTRLNLALGAITTFSRGTLAMTHASTSVLTITSPGTDLTALMTSAYNAAVSAGYVLSNYDHLIVTSPYIAGYAAGQAGFANSTGGIPSCWVRDALDQSKTGTNVITHETLHDLGFGHDNSLYNNDGSVTSTLLTQSSNAYGDYGSVMSAEPYLTFPSAGNMNRTPWISPKNVTMNGDYVISSIETSSPANPHTLIVRPVDTVTPTKRTFYVSLREATGQDVTYSDTTYKATYGDFTNGVMIHYATSGDYAALLRGGADFPLKVGSTFSDPDGTMTINLVSKTASTATVRIAGLPATPT